MLLQCRVINKYYGAFYAKSFIFYLKDFVNASNYSKKYIFVSILNTNYATANSFKRSNRARCCQLEQEKL